MSILMLAIGITLILGCGAGALWFMPSSKKPKRTHFINTGPILNGKQNEIYNQIGQTLGEDYKVFPKVPLQEIIGLDPRMPEKERHAAAMQFANKNIDFCVVKSDTLETICCIMVPRTLAIDQAVIADKALKAALTQAGIPLVHIKPSADLSPASLHKKLKHVIDKDRITEATAGDIRQDSQRQESIQQHYKPLHAHKK